MPVRPALEGSPPDGWLFKESVTFLAPDGGANVIASSEPLDESVTGEEYAQVQGELLRREFPNYVEGEFRQLTVFGERAGYYRSFQWFPPDGNPVVQHQIYFVEGGRGYTATATTSLERSDAYEGDLLRVLESLRIRHTD
jgi:hypothetical protein